MTEAETVARFLQRAARRRAIVGTLSSAAVAVAAALVLLAAGWLGRLSFDVALAAGLACVVAGAISGALRSFRGRRGVAGAVERRAPECRNLLITAAELLEAPASRTALPGPPKPEIVGLVHSRAARLVEGLNSSSLFPLHRVALTLALGVALWLSLAALARPHSLRVARQLSVAPVDNATPVIEAIEVTITPPEYTRGEPRTLVDPARLTALSGARIDLRVRAQGADVSLSTLAGSRDLLRGADGSFVIDLVAGDDGFLALEPRGADGTPGPRRLIGLRVTPDAPPLVRITEPGQDLFFPQADRIIPLAFSARDDYGLDSLRLVYTIVSGSGETFEFTEGELPARLTRTDERAWAATSDLSLPDLGLALGDMVVYRAVARDQRPGAEAADSDSFVVEIMGEDAAIAGGFALESDEEREALSQRMIIVKTERLLAQRSSMTADDYAYEARRLAAEQRAVRAEFVFMMGGEVQDEVEEAEHEHEVAEGRLELRGRQEMSRAILYMSQAATRLANVDLEAALPIEQTALEALQSALARSRYILRVLAERESIDLTRRLTAGAGAVVGQRAGEVAGSDAELAGLRRALAEAAALAALPSYEAPLAGDLADLAEAVLRLDPSAEPLQVIAAELDAAARRVAEGDDEGARDRLVAIVDELASRVEARVPLSPRDGAIDPDLAGALIDALDRGGRR